MARSSKRLNEPVYDIVDTNEAKIFDTRPDRAIRQEFLDYVVNHGSPQTWRYHSHSAPPKNSSPEILEQFEIPIAHRNRQFMAPCPMCSPRFPKYWSGMLAWFPEDKALRAIGKECGHDYLKGDTFRSALAQFNKNKEFDQHYDFLFRNLPKIRDVKLAISALFDRARILDQTRAALKRNISRVFARNLHRQVGGTGKLTLFNEKRVPIIGPAGEFKLDKSGNVMTRIDVVMAATFEFGGSETLLDVDKSAQADLITAEALLKGLSAQTEDEILEALSGLRDEQLSEPVFRIQKAWGMLNGVLLQFEQTKRFLEPSNIESLDRWGRDNRSPLPVICRYDKMGRLEFGQIGKKTCTIPIHGSLMKVVPSISPLT